MKTQFVMQLLSTKDPILVFLAQIIIEERAKKTGRILTDQERELLGIGNV